MRIIIASIVAAVGIAATPVIGTPVSGDDPRVYEMTLGDFSFTLAKPLAAGRRVLRVKNAAAQAHEVVIVQLAPGRTVQDVVAFFLQGEGAPDGKPHLAHGMVATITVE